MPVASAAVALSTLWTPGTAQLGDAEPAATGDDVEAAATFARDRPARRAQSASADRAVRPDVDARGARLYGQRGAAGVVVAHHDEAAASRDPDGELEESGLDRLDGAVVVEVVGLDVGDDRRLRGQ